MRKVALAVLVFLLGAGIGQASTITATLPEFTYGPYPGVPTSGEVGTFAYSIPLGEYIVSATVSGTFGNSLSFSSSPVDVYLDGTMVAQCLATGTCYTPPTDAWSYSFSSELFPALSDGSAVLSYLQTGGVYVRLGDLRLTMETATSVPEPASLLLLGTGLVAAGLVRRRRR